MLIPQTWPWTRKGQLDNFEPFCCLHLGTRLYLSEMTVQIFPQLQVIDCWQTLGGVWSSPSWTTKSIHDSLVNSLFSEKTIPIDDWLIFQHLPIYELVLFPMIFPCFFSHSYPQPWGFPTWVFVISRDPGPHVCECGPGLLPRWSHKGHRELSKGVVLVVLSLEAGLGKCSSWSSWKKTTPGFHRCGTSTICSLFFLGFYNYGYFLVFHIYVNVYGVSIQRCVYIYGTVYIYIHTYSWWMKVGWLLGWSNGDVFWMLFFFTIKQKLGISWSIVETYVQYL